MPRYKITIEYQGTGFAGWQKQQNALSIQGELEKSIWKLSGQKTQVYGSGRTDAGVHALGQVAHFDLSKEYKLQEIVGAINYHIRPHKIGVLEACLVDEKFHARFSAKERHYLYRIKNRKQPVILDLDRVWWVRDELDISKMQEASSYLIGQHDFTSFRASYCQAKSPIKTLNEVKIEKSGDEIFFWVSAPSFLHHMVRNIVGTLTLVGKGQMPPIEVKYILEAKMREAAGVTAPASGLYFYRVDY